MKMFAIRLALIVAASGISCWAAMINDPLHGYCAPALTQCIDNGSNSPTSLNPPSNFGFTVSPGPATGSTLLLDLLEPNNEPNAPATITGTFPGTATLFSPTPWTSGGLDTYLGISASPANPIGAFLPDPADPGATGFFVYQLSIAPAGGVTLQGPADPNVSPLENISGSIPLGTYIVAFLNEGTSSAPSWIATANSGAILETSASVVVPEPSSIILLGSAALGVFTLRKRKIHGGA